jgi:GxxExxY protein
MHENELATKAIGFAREIHRSLGPGLLENAYEERLYYKLVTSGLYTEKQKPTPLVYEAVHLDCGYRIDLVVKTSWS